MIGRLLAIVAWLAVGHLVVGGLYWALLNVPESSVWMLALSALLCLTMPIAAGWFDMTAAFAWLPGTTLRQAARRAPQAVPAFVLGLAFYALVWWLVGVAADWTAMRAGELDAWLMLRFGSPNTAWAHRAIALALVILRDLIGLSIAVSIAVFVGALGVRELVRARWARAAFGRRQLATIALVVVLLIALPIRALYWRPSSLPPTSMEVAFAAAKLSIIYLLVTLGWAYVLRAGMESLVRAEPRAGTPGDAPAEPWARAPGVQAPTLEPPPSAGRP